MEAEADAKAAEVARKQEAADLTRRYVSEYKAHTESNCKAFVFGGAVYLSTIEEYLTTRHVRAHGSEHRRLPMCPNNVRSVAANGCGLCGQHCNQGVACPNIKHQPRGAPSS